MYFSYLYFISLKSELPYQSIIQTSAIVLAYIGIALQVNYLKYKNTTKYLNKIFLAFIFLSYTCIIFIPSYGISIGEHLNKWQGITTHKNTLGNISLFILFFYLWIFKFKTFPAKIITTFSVLILIIGSQSSTAIILAILIIVTNIFSSKSSFSDFLIKRTTYIIIGVLIISTSTAIISTYYQDLLSLSNNLVDTSFTGRINIWLYYINSINENPFFGVGLNQVMSDKTSFNSNMTDLIGYFSGSAHNGFLESIFTTGFIGFILSILYIKSIYHKNNSTKNKLIFLIFVLLYIMVNTFESYSINFNLYTFILFYIERLSIIPSTLHNTSATRKFEPTILQQNNFAHRY